MVIQFNGLALARLAVMGPVYVTVLSIELFVLDRLLKVSALRVDLMQEGNLTVEFLEEELTQISSKDFHKRRVRFSHGVAPARIHVETTLDQIVDHPHQIREGLEQIKDDFEDLERRYLGRHSMS